MQTNLLKRTHPNKKRMTVARGGKRGKTSGRGGKGQTARAGNKRRPELRDIIKKLPKNRGYQFKSIHKLILLPKEKIISEGGKQAPPRVERHHQASSKAPRSRRELEQNSDDKFTASFHHQLEPSRVKLRRR